jgi:hypothetical protein
VSSAIVMIDTPPASRSGRVEAALSDVRIWDLGVP